MPGWKSDEISSERRKRAETQLADATREQLVDRIIALETSLYKMTYSLKELDIEAQPRGRAFMVSKLFPCRYLDKEEKSEFCAFDRDQKQFVGIEVTPETMHKIEYALEDSVEIKDGSKLPDDFEILSVHQSVFCASVYGGAVFMGDVREAAKLLWGQ